MANPKSQIPSPNSQEAPRRDTYPDVGIWPLGFGIRDLGFGIWGCILALAMASAACGKKGPPLAPIVRIPAAVEKINAERVGADVFVTLTVPAQNVDASKPADVARVDIYSFTATTPPARGQFLAQAERVAVIPVAPAPRPDGSIPTPAGDRVTGASQGKDVTIRDVLTPDRLVPKPPPELPARRGRAPRPVTPAAIADVREEIVPVLRRFYMAIA